MAGWSTLRDGYGLNCDEIGQGRVKLRDESGNVMSMEEGKDKEDGIGMLRGLFDQVLVVFLREVCAEDQIRRIPALVGSGQSVDLFRLFYLVRERGGFDSVTKEKLWGLIAESLEMEFGFSASLKLVYFKYLDELDQLLNRVGKDGSFINKGSKYDGELELLSVELEKRLRGLLVDEGKRESMDIADITAGCDEICDRVDVSIRENFRIPGVKNENKLLADSHVATCDDDEKMKKGEGDKTVGRSDPLSFQRDSNNRKRKRQDWQAMLCWLKNVARNPRDISSGRIPHSSRWIKNGGKEPWSLALFVREAKLKRRYSDSKDDGCSSNQKKQKIHPTIYNDPGSGHLDSVRSSKRVQALAKSPRCPCCDSSVTKESKSANHCKGAQMKKDLVEAKKEKTPDPPSAQPSEPTARPSPDKLPIEKHVNVGPQFQADVPPWTGVVSEIDCNWGGIRVWPPGHWKENTYPDKHLALGKGRPDMCDCLFPCSVECVRFHTAENKMKLKHELGRAFYQWKFDRMGEVVSLSWTPQEEEKFKSVLSTTPLSVGRSSFRKKKRQEVIDYYFNVFLQRKRSYQNRVTPNAVDSDDELSEFGSVGGLFGNAASNISGPKPGICVQNKQCLDMDTAVKVRKS